MNLANANSPIPGFSTKIVPDLHGIFNSPKAVLSGDPLYSYCAYQKDNETKDCVDDRGVGRIQWK